MSKRNPIAIAAATALLALLLAAPAARAEFGIAHFDGEALRQNGEAATQAGSRPHTASTTFLVSEKIAGDGYSYVTEDIRDVTVDLPAGLVGNVNSIPTCAEFELSPGNNVPECPLGSQVGYVVVLRDGPVAPSTDEQLPVYVALYNMKAPDGTAALLGFNVGGDAFHISGGLHRDPGVPGGYRVRTQALNSPETLTFAGAKVVVWGVPADPSFDAIRGSTAADPSGSTSCAEPGQPANYCNTPHPSGESRRPFLTLPTSCPGPVASDLTVTSWPGSSASSSFLSHDTSEPPVPTGNDGCEELDFSPTLSAHPTTDVADSPTGLDVDLQVPQREGPDENAEANLKDTTVTLPEGLVVNPASANGLDACSEAQAELESDEPAHCPDAAKVASVEVETPLLDHPVPGAAYLATPHDNPFGSLLALYIAIDDPVSGTVAKIAGKVSADPVTGRLSSTFEENPQLPFEHFKLRFFAGADASLRTPSTCGAYQVSSRLTSWAGQASAPSDAWQIAQGPQGSCAHTPAEQPNSPSFDAGTVSPISSSYSPFVLHLRREDGSQGFQTITVSPPPGLVAKLAGTALCPDAALAAAEARSGREEQAAPSCPVASRIGSVDAAAGAGPAPFHAPGIVYLAGPYKGAPLSMAILTPAVAGPFDLGTIVIRTALHVDPATARITAVSDPIPPILEGIPTDVRSADVVLDRPEFTLTGTSCDPSAVVGTLTSTLGQPASLLSRFQLSDCQRLGFKPKISLSLRGATKRGGHPALTVVLRPRPGDANIASLSLAMPHAEFLDQAHIRTVCTRVQFAADACPPGAVYGQASVSTPILDYPLAGNVYLRSSDNLLPDLVPDLRGPAYQPLQVSAAGRTDSIHGGIRNTFDFVPDAPFAKLVTKLPGGKKGLLENSTDICRKPFYATVRYTAHNGLSYTDRPRLRVRCKGAKQRGRSKPHGGRG